MGSREFFFGSDFISITKNNNHEWQMLKPSISKTITECYKSGAAIMLQGEEDKTDISNTEDNEAVIKINLKRMENASLPPHYENRPFPFPLQFCLAKISNWKG